MQVSTDEVYGSLGKTGKFTEKTPLAPNSPYSSSKASADMIALSYYKTYQLPVIVTRCSNNYVVPVSREINSINDYECTGRKKITVIW